MENKTVKEMTPEEKLEQKQVLFAFGIAAASTGYVYYVWNPFLKAIGQNYTWQWVVLFVICSGMCTLMTKAIIKK
jgi:magnesium-transporting ATPase (P-type)